MCVILSAGRGSDSGKNRRSLRFEQVILTEEVEVGKWARSMASKSQWKPSAPPSACASVIASRDADISKDKNLPEDHDKSVAVSRGGQGVMHINETVDDAMRGQKHTLSTTSLDDPEEQCEMEEDQDANEHILDKDEDVDMTDQQSDMELSTGGSCEIDESLTTIMDLIVSIMDTTMDGPKSKYITTKNGCVQCTILNLKKEKPKNSHLPNAAQNLSFYSIFIPMVMHWVGNINYPWTILDEKLSDVLEDIFMAVCKQPGDFRNDDGCNLAFNLMSEFPFWYAKGSLSREAERALILARNDLIVEDALGHRKHKIALTLNHSTNKMSNTGTAFSAGNWETDTLVYME
ncbi:uncharacterized protein EDB93DRAFT_1103922 [Suillus bovinus]|uniref:uncharacterized protein n=1 Tax=Suillus bovinus TaxID=48563 RepID=UPI001B86B14E|nr:uncharacterized protein EDB93DRAFT_1103922 [Suillus bovinus]KAG2147839.1 hypothetical protein EDB93DRAFT_1103922 [Suillus bovinus]